MAIIYSPAGETGLRFIATPGAEGATAPETLRQKDRAGVELLESRAAERQLSPKG